jgi:hypothetical protein
MLVLVMLVMLVLVMLVMLVMLVLVLVLNCGPTCACCRFAVRSGTCAAAGWLMARCTLCTLLLRWWSLITSWIRRAGHDRLNRLGLAPPVTTGLAGTAPTLSFLV